MNVYKSILFGAAVVVCGQSHAQTFNPSSVTIGGRAHMAEYTYAWIEDAPPPQVITTPPASSVRTLAEWEEIEALIVTYTGYPSIVRQIIKYAREECHVYVVCSDSNAVKTALTNEGTPLSNISFVVLPYNTIWVRDYGPWTIYKNDVDSIYQIDWIYNRPRPKDDTIPQAISRMSGYRHYQTVAVPYDLMNTGGNFMTDGLGTGFASKLVLQENDGNGGYPITYPNHSEAEIDSIMAQFMGMNRYIKMETLPYDGIHHIDMHMKLLDEETLLVGEYPTGVADGPQIEQNLQYVLSNFNSPFGTPYKVIRIVQPPAANGKYPDQGGDYRTYANAVFINKTVLLPTYQEQYDTTALRIWREALPGYRIVGIDCNAIIPAGGALHCITKEIGSSDPMLIVHQPLTDQPDLQFTINATIKHISGIDDAFVWWRQDTTQPFAGVPMSAQTNDNWTATINASAGMVQYYVSADAFSGKSQVRPLVAPAGFWRFDISGPVAIFHVENAELSVGNPYPQPGREAIRIPVSVDRDLQTRIWLLDAGGRLVDEIMNGWLDAGKHHVVVEGAVLDAGLYMVVFEAGGQRQIVRVVIQ